MEHHNRRTMVSESKPETPATKNIASLTSSSLQSQYRIYNPMDNKLLHLIVSEHQYLQFLKVLATSRRNANRLLNAPHSGFYLDADITADDVKSMYQEYHDVLLRSFSSDSTEQTTTENLTEDEEEDHEALKTIKQDIKKNNDVVETTNMDNLLGELNLQDYESDREVNSDSGDGITLDDLEKYEQLLNDFESTRDEELNSTMNTEDIKPPSNPSAMDTSYVLEGLSDVGDGDDSMTVGENSFTNYIRQKFGEQNNNSLELIGNPQEFLKKVSKIWNLMPRNLKNFKRSDDINKDQFHEFFIKWKEQHKHVSSKKDSSDDEDGAGEDISTTKKLTKLIRLEPDIDIPESQITQELIDQKISVISIVEPSAPFDFFFNDKVKEILQEKQNFNLKKKQLRSIILIQWEKLSVLEKLRYSSIFIDVQKPGGMTQFSSPTKRSVSYHGSATASKMSSPVRSVSYITPPSSAASPPLASGPLPTLQFDLSNKRTPSLSPPMSPDKLERPQVVPVVSSNVRDEVRRLNKKKSWGKDDKWL